MWGADYSRHACTSSLAIRTYVDEQPSFGKAPKKTSERDHKPSAAEESDGCGEGSGAGGGQAEIGRATTAAWPTARHADGGDLRPDGGRQHSTAQHSTSLCKRWRHMQTASEIIYISTFEEKTTACACDFACSLRIPAMHNTVVWSKPNHKYLSRQSLMMMSSKKPKRHDGWLAWKVPTVDKEEYVFVNRDDGLVRLSSVCEGHTRFFSGPIGVCV